MPRNCWLNARKAQPQAFGDLYDLYYGRILNYVYRRTLDAAVAEEVTSNTFFNALRALPRYDNRGKFGAWLYRIATNEIRLNRRSQRNRQEGNSRWRAEFDRIRFTSHGSVGALEEDIERKTARVRPDSRRSWLPAGAVSDRARTAIL